MNRYCTFKTLFEKAHRNSQNFEDCFADFLDYCMSRLNDRHVPKDASSHFRSFSMDIIWGYYPKMFGEVESFAKEEAGSPLGNDLLGEFYEEKMKLPVGLRFESFPAILSLKKKLRKEDSPGIFIEGCDSGRMLLACGRIHGNKRRYVGSDTNLIFVKMTAVNLLLNGLRGEAVLLDNTEKFRRGYRISPEKGIVVVKNEEELKNWMEVKKETGIGIKPLIPREIAERYIFSFISQRRTYLLHSAECFSIKEKDYSVQVENGMVTVTELYGVAIEEKFPLKEIVAEIAMRVVIKEM